jgi:hypothetical protein
MATINDQLNAVYYAYTGTLANTEQLTAANAAVDANGITATLLDIAASVAPTSSIFPAGDSNEAFVAKLYSSVIGRTSVDAAESNYWLGELANGDSRETVMVKFTNAVLAYVSDASIPNNDAGVAATTALLATLNPQAVTTLSGAEITGTVGTSEVFSISSSVSNQVKLIDFTPGEDSIQFDLDPVASLTTLDQLNGYQLSDGDVIAVQLNQATGSTFVNLGLDSAGEAISLNIVGVTDASTIDISII